MHDQPPNHPPPQAPEPEDGYTLTVAQAAERLGRSENSVRRLIGEGKLPAIRVKGERVWEHRIRARDIDQLRGRLEALPPGHALAQVPEGMADVPALLGGLTAALTRLSEQATEREAAQVAERERLQAHARLLAEELGRARGLLSAERERRRAVEAELDRRRRPWWRRILGP